MDEQDRLASFHILELANQGRVEYVIAQMLSSMFITSNMDRREKLSCIESIIEFETRLEEHQNEIWPALLPGGIIDDLPYDVVKRENHIEMIDTSKHVISFFGRRNKGEWQLLKDAVTRYSESPLNFAEEIKHEIMKLVNASTFPEDNSDGWTRNEIIAWITHVSSGADYTMTWTQANDIGTLDELSHRGFDMDDHFQMISDNMFVDGRRFAAERGTRGFKNKAY
jgi:hypothetical protein